MKNFLKILILFVAAGVIIVVAYNINAERKEKIAVELYSETAKKYSFQYSIDTNLVLAVIKAESNFKEKAVSPKGAMGLMQIMPNTGKFIAGKIGEEFVESSLADFETNIKYGTYYLSYLYKKFSDLDCILASYNAGEGNVSYWLTKYSDDGVHLNEIPFEETAKYVEKVKLYYSRFKQVYNY